ncbi:MAG: hypothetical protein J5I98_07680 [Phaeodactylibacter sp.]|nr:hypothetical protein [Phaeodactylibacter sp.]
MKRELFNIMNKSTEGYSGNQGDTHAFITNQSKDAVRAFYSIASRLEYRKQALFLRLQRSRKGQIEGVSYPIERLGNVLEMGVEAR